MKPSYKTSEFWFTLVSFIFSGLFLLGILKDYSQKEELISVISHGVESVILIGGQLLIFAKYINGRNKTKIEYEKTQQKKYEYEEEEESLTSYNGVDKKQDVININTSSIGDLIQLPGIGTKLAHKILKYRKTHGDFESTEDILQVHGIAESIYSQIKNNIVV